MDAIVQSWPHQCWAEREDHLPWPADNIAPNVQDSVTQSWERSLQLTATNNCAWVPSCWTWMLEILVFEKTTMQSLQPFWYNSSLVITFAWNWHFIDQDFLDLQDKSLIFLISHFFPSVWPIWVLEGNIWVFRYVMEEADKQWELQSVLNPIIFQCSKHKRFIELEKTIMSCIYFSASSLVYNILTSPSGQPESSFCISGLLKLQHLSLPPPASLLSPSSPLSSVGGFFFWPCLAYRSVPYAPYVSLACSFLSF